ncbi:MAG: cell division protein [Burkholderiales bacterium]|jgi:hypothetical protein
MNRTSLIRIWVVRWMYAAALCHGLVGIGLVLGGNGPWLDAYHQSLVTAFWDTTPAPHARVNNAWWMALFGATIQCLAVWMLALVHLGKLTRMPQVWLWLMAGLVLWAPQDMIISAQAGVWSHVWVDALALASMLPPLVWLYKHDQQHLHNHD